MVRVVAVAILAIVMPLPAAPQLRQTNGEVVSPDAKGEYLLVDNFACERLTVTFEIQGKKKNTYTLELYVEPYGTGERAILVQTKNVVTDDLPKSLIGTARGTIQAGTQSARIPGPALLPNVGKGDGWSYCLLLKEGEKTIAMTGFCWVHYPGKPD